MNLRELEILENLRKIRKFNKIKTLNPNQTKLFWPLRDQGGEESRRSSFCNTKCSLRHPICMQMTKNGSQYKILVFSCPYIPKTVFFDDYFSRERSRKELGY